MSRLPSSFLDQGLGSEEEEDDDFNPTPAEDSDTEQADKQEVEFGEPRMKGEKHARVERIMGDAGGEDDEDLPSSTGIHQDIRKRRDHEENDGNESAAANDGLGDDDEVPEDEDEDEEEEEDEGAVSGRPRKRRRGGLNAFFEEEAEVEEEEEDVEEEEEDMEAEFVHPDDDAILPAGAETDDRRHRELDRKRDLEATMDAEKQAQALKERYGRNRATASDLVVVPKRLLLPSVEDPSIWAVKCRPGKEREIVFNVMKRMEERHSGSRNPIRITSIFERGGTMSGYIYVEARKQADVMDALENLSNVFIRSKLTLISVKEMPDLLRVQKSEELQPGGWVRIKRGKYQGDLAQIEEVETNGLEVTVRLVPRLDYGMNDDVNGPNGDSKRKRPGGSNPAVARPPQRLFSEAEAKKRHGRYLSAAAGLGGKSWTYLGDTYIDGFLIKDMKIQHLITKNVNPQLDEVTRFARGADDGTVNLDLASLAASLKNTTSEDSYVPGDTVEVFSGEQRGVVGRVLSGRADIVSIKVTEGELEDQRLDVPIKSLRKRFREGDHVKVIGGSKYRDELGMVVRIKDDRVTLLTDMSMQEITVFSKDLREAEDAGVDGKLGQYDVHDLVQIDQTTVGCIIKLDRESMKVLDQNGSTRTLLPSRVIGKIEHRRNAVTTDRNGAEIKFADTVREVTGEQRLGVILHVHRAFLFMNSKVVGDNAGIIVSRATNVVTVATSGGSLAPRGPDLSKMNPALQKNGLNGNGMPPPRSIGRDRIVGKTVTIRKGPYKGLLGIIKDTTDEIARVELHSVSKVVPVEKENLTIKEYVSHLPYSLAHIAEHMQSSPITGQPIDLRQFSRGGPGRGGPRTPQGASAAPPRAGGAWQGGRTPMAVNDSSRTPAWRSSSSRTPAWNAAAASGARTPSWKTDGSRTVNAYDAGYKTSLGSRTPAWAAGSKTPRDVSGFGASSGSGFDAFLAGSRTPAPASLLSGSRTPAWGHSSGSSGGKAFDAPTPGGDYAAPSPAVFGAAPTPGASAPTPRPWNDAAPTPGASAPTPGASSYSAPTPAGGMGYPATPGAMDDGGPRYEEGTPSP
ncbi:transcription elongation factor spt5 [Ophidiomyces ophidiicola]|uniref:Transcription elongation factor spt5 n=1 Tax=Ophidiomyces ophidiicola TaxID=1387563 RepID=A0ACB8UZ97_9EURO|nr:transcription elongation factor spt5 [Ophidiomyces ophidiicola]KAI1908942.1 transcription elongation factor spt5 [Ophidiomyces ophidiicola]KAI1919092.1 transcription elongation factor spt5 [Ophidiomyces ophidiicola]KAI1926812.1 transcription elongation factor spt5 [Ophidiomyces ophidiicola]KAI1950993.1 transcription elongation factor spt5 [Ophidiomyces ophidiicola]KAI1952212.1 transcription elongation factor spt5 [Ophidiomyces ophidiicola]